jgi:hypothetical protein
MRTFLLILVGMILMYIILKLLSHKTVSTDSTWQEIKPILTSSQFYNLTKTNEFRELIKMPETKKVIETMANDQVTLLAQSLFNKQF